MMLAEHVSGRILRLICLLAALAIIGNLFYLGAKPVAVGLFPPPLDKLAHFAAFGLIAALLWLSLLRGHPLLLVAIVAVVGAADELYQHFLPGRSASLVDLAMDILAAAAIVALLEYARRRYG